MRTRDEGSSDVLAETVDYYRARAAEYDEWFYRKGRYDRSAATNSGWFAESEELFSFFDSLPPTGQAMELAPGTGIWTERLIRLADHITALDASAEMLAINRAKLGDKQERVTYIEANLFDWQPEPNYDCVVFCFWLSHIPDRQLDSFLRKVAAALHLGGKLFFVHNQRAETASSPDQPPSRPADEIATRQLNDGRQFQIVKNFYDPADLTARFQAAGLSVDVHETETYFIYGFGQRA